MNYINYLILLLLFVQYQGDNQRTTGKFTLNHGTTIIAFLKDEVGWIAAGTKVNVVTNGAITGSHRARKIKQTNDIFYAFAVHPMVRFNDELIYDAFSLMESTVKKEKEFKKAFDTFDLIIK